MKILVGLTLALSIAGPSGDTIRLRNGKCLSGTIHLDESTTEGFVLRPWDTGGTLFIRWSQLTSTEIDRILNRTLAPVPNADLVDGIQVFTATRTVVGVLVRRHADHLAVKTAASRTLVLVPVSAVLREDRIAIPESDAYDPAERIDRRLSRLAADDVEGLTGLAGMASRLGLYERARELYLRAAAVGPARKEEIDALIGANEALGRERRAASLLGEVGALSRKAEYDQAIALAKRLLGEWSDTEIARGNKGLVADLEKEAHEWVVKKSEILARRIPDAYRGRIMEGVVQASRLTKFSEARASAGRLEEEVVKDLAHEFKSTPEEVRTAWGRREQRVRTVGFAAGSWIILGGQEGGLDTEAKFIPVQRNFAKPAPPPIPLGLALDTADEWWAKASHYERLDWLEAEFARTAPGVQRTTRERRCSRCVGAGDLSVSRRGIDCVAKCPRCHGAKLDLSVEYH